MSTELESCAYCHHWAEPVEPGEKFGYCTHEHSKQTTYVEGGEEAYRDNLGDLRTLAFHRCKRFEVIQVRLKKKDQSGSD
jgi:hypothetical protein